MSARSITWAATSQHRTLVNGLVLMLSAVVLVAGALLFSKAVPEGPRFTEVLAPFPELGYIGTTDPRNPTPTPRTQSSAPRVFDSGKHYLFLVRRTAVPLAWRDYASRLEHGGWRVVEKPRDDRDLLHLIVGGPLFRIAFQRGPVKGELINAVDHAVVQDAALAQEWMPEDIIISFQY